jgi:hypothetical protein
MANRPEHQVEIKLTEALTSAVELGNEVNRLHAALREIAWLIELRGENPPWYWHAEPDPRCIGGFDPDVNKAMRFCREKDARAMALMLGASGMIAITDVRRIEITEHMWTDGT